MLFPSWAIEKPCFTLNRKLLHCSVYIHCICIYTANVPHWNTHTLMLLLLMTETTLQRATSLSGGVAAHTCTHTLKQRSIRWGAASCIRTLWHVVRATKLLITGQLLEHLSHSCQFVILAPWWLLWPVYHLWEWVAYYDMLSQFIQNCVQSGWGGNTSPNWAAHVEAEHILMRCSPRFTISCKLWSVILRLLFPLKEH